MRFLPQLGEDALELESLPLLGFALLNLVVSPPPFCDRQLVRNR